MWRIVVFESNLNSQRFSTGAMAPDFDHSLSFREKSSVSNRVIIKKIVKSANDIPIRIQHLSLWTHPQFLPAFTFDYTAY